MLSLALALSLALQAQDTDPGYLLGWTLEPPAPVEGEETELDRLSRSPSGAGFLPKVYGSDSDDDRIPISVTLRALDKITARFTDLVVPIGMPESFGTLTLIPRTCSTRPPEEFPETTVFLEVYASAEDVAGQRVREEVVEEVQEELPPIEASDPIGEMIETTTIAPSIDEEIFGDAVFKGWMFASTPSLNALEHPTYDVWVIDCKMEDPEI